MKTTLKASYVVELARFSNSYIKILLRIISFVFVLSTAFFFTSTVGTANAETSDVSVIIDGHYVNFPDVQPYISNNRTYVPLRFVTEQLGATVEWDGDRRRVTIKNNDDLIEFGLRYRNKITKNKTNYTIDAVLGIVNGRMMVPLRVISEMLGVKVDWNSTTKTVAISTTERPVPEEESEKYWDKQVLEKSKNNSALSHMYGIDKNQTRSLVASLNLFKNNINTSDVNLSLYYTYNHNQALGSVILNPRNLEGYNYGTEATWFNDRTDLPNITITQDHFLVANTKLSYDCTRVVLEELIGVADATKIMDAFQTGHLKARTLWRNNGGFMDTSVVASGSVTGYDFTITEEMHNQRINLYKTKGITVKQDNVSLPLLGLAKYEVVLPLSGDSIADGSIDQQIQKMAEEDSYVKTLSRDNYGGLFYLMVGLNNMVANPGEGCAEYQKSWNKSDGYTVGVYSNYQGYDLYIVQFRKAQEDFYAMWIMLETLFEFSDADKIWTDLIEVITAESTIDPADHYVHDSLAEILASEKKGKWIVKTGETSDGYTYNIRTDDRCTTITFEK